MAPTSALSLLAVLAMPALALAHEGVHTTLARVEHALRANPTLARHLRAARLSRRAGDFAKSLQHLRDARRLARHAPLIDRERGLTFAKMGRLAQADHALSRYLRRSRQPDRRALWTRARVRVQRRRTTAALSDYARALRADAEPDLCLEAAQLQRTTGRVAAASRTLKRCLSQLGDSAVVREALARLELRRGRLSAARAALEPLLRSAHVSPQWHLLGASLAERSGDDATARAIRLAALRETDTALTQRRSALLLVQRAHILHALGRRDAARGAVASALSLAPRFAAAHALQRELSP